MMNSDAIDPKTIRTIITTIRGIMGLAPLQGRRLRSVYAQEEAPPRPGRCRRAYEMLVMFPGRALRPGGRRGRSRRPPPAPGPPRPAQGPAKAGPEQGAGSATPPRAPRRRSG